MRILPAGLIVFRPAICVLRQQLAGSSAAGTAGGFDRMGTSERAIAVAFGGESRGGSSTALAIGRYRGLFL
jgi:hypothetical protein